MIELHALFRGRVQGVGFRATARHIAQQLGLKGTVKNLADGSVEIYAQGSRDSLEKFVKRLEENFSLEETEIEAEYYSASKPFERFEIIV